LSTKEESIRGKAYVDALAHSARGLGATCLQRVEVTRLEIDGDKVIGVRTLTETYHSGHTIIAAGPWTGISGAGFLNRYP
jgi:glycine/D-amino acid oxidase-like deaminating enzyme